MLKGRHICLLNWQTYKKSKTWTQPRLFFLLSKQLNTVWCLLSLSYRKKHRRIWGNLPPLRDMVRFFSFLIRGGQSQKRNTSTSTSTHKTCGSLDVDWRGITSSGRGNSRTVGWLGFFSLPIQGQTKRVKTPCDYKWNEFVLFHGVGVIFWDVEKGTWKITLTWVKRRGGGFVFPWSNSACVTNSGPSKSKCQNRQSQNRLSRLFAPESSKSSAKAGGLFQKIIVGWNTLKQVTWVFRFRAERSHLWPKLWKFEEFWLCKCWKNRRDTWRTPEDMWAVKKPMLSGL